MFMGISRHPGPVDVAALHPLLHAGPATLAAARITAKIGAALFGAGYASDANFTTACDPELSTSRSPDEPARPAGSPTAKRPAPANTSWQRWPPRSIISARHGFPLPRRPIQAVLRTTNGPADDQHTGLILVYGPVSMIWVPQQHI
jgi:hypothetical protein